MHLSIKGLELTDNKGFPTHTAAACWVGSRLLPASAWMFSESVLRRWSGSWTRLRHAYEPPGD